MYFKTTYEASEFINQKHSNFAGYKIYTNCENPRAFDTLMGARCFLNEEPAAISVTFDAVLEFSDTGPLNTTITMIPHGSDEWEYIEKESH